MVSRLNLLSLAIPVAIFLLLVSLISQSKEMTTITTIKLDAYALQQVAGRIVVDVRPGETKYFKWAILYDTNQSDVSNVNISASGNGSEFLSFPKSVALRPSGEITNVPVNVTIPANYSTNIELKPIIRATEAGEKIGSTIINIEMSKILSIVIDKNQNQTLATGVLKS